MGQGGSVEYESLQTIAAIVVDQKPCHSVRSLLLRRRQAVGPRQRRSCLPTALRLLWGPCCGATLEAAAAIPFCAECYECLAPEGLAQCRRCASVVNPIEQQAGDCSRCRTERFQFERVFALSRYEGPLRDAVLRMKRSIEEPLMMAMGRLLAQRFRHELQALKPDVVVPVPMHWTRRLVRGTNSPEVMGQVVARQFGIVFGPRALRRQRRTRKLAELSRQERKRTLRNAFSIARGCDFAAARVLLVDDVLTTGTTCDTAARVLKKGGAAEVSVLVAARAYPGG
jgi:ComF family protein